MFESDGKSLWNTGDAVPPGVYVCGQCMSAKPGVKRIYKDGSKLPECPVCKTFVTWYRAFDVGHRPKSARKKEQD